jgi:flavorubredoxin
MKSGIPIAQDTFWVGVNDRDTRLFESLWPLPYGIAYNAYLIADRKVALIDAVKGLYFPHFVRTVRDLLPEGRTLDYLVINHIEPDHSGAVRALLEMFPGLQVVGNRKTAEFLEHLHGVTDAVRIVEEGSELDLGGRKLRFFLTPMVHWPETMLTYDPRTRVLFTGDVFGGYGNLEGGIFDEDAPDRGFFEDEMLRYFSNVLGKFGPMVAKALGRVRGLDVAVIAPAHGLVWRQDPARPLELFDRWSRHEVAPGVVVAYGTMYADGERMMEFLARRLVEEGIRDIRVHDVSRSHLSYILRDLWRVRGLVVGTPTYNLGIFPPVEDVLRYLESKRVRNHVLGIFGTYGWSGGGVKGVREWAGRAEWELVEPVVEARFSPKPEDFEGLTRLAQNLAARVQRPSDA